MNSRIMVQWVCLSLVGLPVGVMTWATSARANPVEPLVEQNAIAQPLPDLNAPATTVAEWEAQIAQSLVQVTGVELNPTQAGLNLVLTASGPLGVLPTRTEGNTLIAEIPNAVLKEAFEQANPTAEIALVRVTNIAGDRVRVEITGTNAPPAAQISGNAAGLTVAVSTATEPVAETEEEEDPEEEELIVTGQQEGGYAVPNASVGTKTDTPIKDVPQSIQVIPKQVLEDQGATSFVDALRNVSGINRDGDPGIFEIRGFGANILSDGSNAPPSASSPFNAFDLSNIEQIEVLKGPASILYGSGSPGGTVNLTTEKPLKEARYQIQGTIGNFNFYRGDLDLTGPLNESKSILYRLNIAYEDAGSFVDFVNSEKLSIFPTLKIELGKSTALTLEGGYQASSERGLSAGLPIRGTVLPNPLGEIPRSRNRADPRNTNESSASYVGYLLEHNFSKDWSLRNRFRASFSDRKEIGIGGGELADDNRTLTRSGGKLDSNGQEYTLQTEILGKAKTGIVNHELLFGLELGRSVINFSRKDVEASPIDIFNPDYGDFPSSSDFFDLFNETGKDDRIGLYAQNLLSIGDKVKVLLGGRYDWVWTNFEDRIANTSSSENASAFAPRVGIVYQPIKPISLYASWSRSFEPNFGVDREGNPFVPTTGDQFEAGVKTEFFDSKLATTLSAYQITRQNDFIPDPVDPDFEVQLGEQRSRGFEFDLTGEPLPGLRLIATYAYTDARVTKDAEGGNEGNRIDNTPPHSGSLWAVYEFQKGSLKGFGIGAGVFVVGKRPGDTANTYTLPAYARTDALLYYRNKRWRVQLNIENLFDVRYFTQAFDREAVYDGAPFTIKGQVSVTF